MTTKTKQSKKFKCVGCGKPTSLGIPYNICPSCSKILDNFFKVKDAHTDTIRKSFGIIQFKFEGDDDITDSLNTIAEQIADIEEQLQWIKNGLMNIAIYKDEMK
jgi:hypothetical protein